MNQEALADATSLVEETIAGIRVVKGLGAEAALSARFRRRSDDVVRTALDVADVDAVFLPALEALPLVGILVVLWYGGHQALDGDITIGTFAAFSFYLALLVAPLRTIGQRVGTVQRAVAAAQRGSSTCCGPSRSSLEPARPRAVPADRRPTSASTTSASATATSDGVLDGFTLEIPAGTRSRSSARPARASRRPPRCSRASTTRTRAV